jgi:two-component system response regulator YesN
LLRRTINYIEKRYDQEISLKTLSVLFHTNSAYLGQIFRKETGCIFSQYLNQFRVEKASELLEHTNLHTSEISQKVGYSSPDYFYNILKKYTGIYPADFKREPNTSGKAS